MSIQKKLTLLCRAQFPKDDLNLIEAIFDEASVHPRNIVLTRYEKYFARPNEVLDTYPTLYAVRMVGYACLRTVRASFFLLRARSRQNHITWKAVNRNPGKGAYMRPKIKFT